MNHIGFDDIVRTYELTEAQVTACLLRLDKIGFLELLPNNRVKLLIARTFSWIANGPIQSYFRSEAAADYLNARFDGEGEVLGLVNVMLSKQSSAALIERLKQVAADIAQQHQNETRVPLEQKQAMSFMLAARPWVPQSFQALLRKPSNQRAIVHETTSQFSLLTQRRFGAVFLDPVLRRVQRQRVQDRACWWC